MKSGGQVPLSPTLRGVSLHTRWGLDEGALLYVETLRSYFSLDKNSTQTVDGITVVYTKSATQSATPPGPGRWLRLPIAHPS